MELEAFFLTTAEISVVLIGFVTIFLTFVMSGREIGKADRMHSRALLTGAYPLLFVPFVPIAANAYGVSEATTLFSFHLAGVLASVMIGVVMMGFYSRLSWADVKEVGWIHTVVSFALGWGAWGFFLAGMLGYAPAGNAVVAVILSFLLTGTALFSFAAQQMKLFDWNNP
ncbi:hypothetical protein [Altererythrobacter sp. MF3-039]|uniref:hypothetical protein n=1 Tax=Altererythrobacter sp. MF3-039 TaxID=3252901 RepID=UPI00390C673A